MCVLSVWQWVEDMCACRLGVLRNLVVCRLMSCRPWSGHCVTNVIIIIIIINAQGISDTEGEKKIG